MGVPIVAPPAVAPAPPGPETPSLGGDAAHRNAWLGAQLRPPLEVAWRAEATPAVAPLAVGTRVIVESAHALTAYEASSGTPLWNASLDEPAELATDGARVFLASASGVKALSLENGSVDWERSGPSSVGPTVADGRVIVGTAAGALSAFNATSGAPAWSVPTGIADGRPAVAGNRAFVAGRCRAAAVATTTGLPIWTAGSCPTDTGTRTLLAGPFVLGEDAGIYTAEDGTVVTPGPAPGTIGTGVLFLSPLTTEQHQLQAIDASSFKPRWTWAPPLPGRMLLRPAAVDSTIWQVVDEGGDGLVLAALDAAKGTERWTGFLPVGEGQGELTPTVATAVATAPGLLLVPTDGGGMVALRNAPAGPLGVSATVPRNVYAAGSRAVIKGTLVDNGHGLVGPRSVVLEADPFPYGGYDVAGSVTAGRGGFSLPVTIARNTRYRFAADGVTYPPTTIYAEPALAVTYERTTSKRVVRATLRIAAARGLRRRGARVGIYRRKPGRGVLRRLGHGTTAAGGVAVFDVRIPASLKRTDRILTCMRGASRQGFGYPDVLDRHCGNRRISVPAQASAASSSPSRRSLRTGTGSAMPLIRLAPASEKR